MHTKWNICAIVKQVTFLETLKTDGQIHIPRKQHLINRKRHRQLSIGFQSYGNQTWLAVVVLILLYGCTIWTLTKWLEKKLDGNYTRMLRAILNKSWRQHPTRHQLYGHLPPIMKTIQARRTRHAGHCWRSKDELISNVLLWTLAYS